MSIQPIMASSFSSSTSSIYEPPKTATTSQRPQSALSVASPSVGSFSFPSKQQCAGCQKMVALMEPGVVPGPKGTRWHSSCLVCGGKGAQRRMGEPGCGKKLDRDAKSDSDGKIWCSTCMVRPLNFYRGGHVTESFYRRLLSPSTANLRTNLQSQLHMVEIGFQCMELELL
jgi:hypothetical protein